MKPNAEHVSRVLAAEGIKMSATSVKKWTHLPFWIKAVDTLLSESQDTFKGGMAEMTDDILGGLRDIATGKDKDNKTSMAQVRLGYMRAEMGDKPLINRKGAFQAQVNIQINNVPVGESVARGWTQEQLSEYARTGKKPEEG